MSRRVTTDSFLEFYPRDVDYPTLTSFEPQDVSPTLARPQSPFAICGILLVADALVDLIVVTKVPQINEIMAAADALNSRSIQFGEGGSRTTVASFPRSPFVRRIAALYSEIWTLLAASRFCLFFAVSFFIYQSKPNAWGLDPGAGVSGGPSLFRAVSGLDQLKNRVVFTYGFVEMIFWLWVSVQTVLHYLLYLEVHFAQNAFPLGG
jgi:hypothetical protein